MQESLFHENLNDALGAAISALGGYKKVGPMLRPEMLIETASNWLRDCLNPDRREFLHPDQVVFIMREARKAGCHSLTAYMLWDCGYSDPVPIEPDDEKAKLMREFNASTQALARIAARIESLGGPTLKQVA